MNKLIFVFAGPALFGLMAVLAARTDVPQTIVATVSASQDDQFNNAWRDAAVPTALKSAMLATTQPKIVQTETITVTPEVIVMEEEKSPPKPKRVDKNICQKHKMHKVHHGKSWRCKK